MEVTGNHIQEPGYKSGDDKQQKAKLGVRSGMKEKYHWQPLMRRNQKAAAEARVLGSAFVCLPTGIAYSKALQKSSFYAKDLSISKINKQSR